MYAHVKSELEEKRSHKVVTVMSMKFDLLLLQVSLKCATFHCSNEPCVKFSEIEHKIWFKISNQIELSSSCRKLNFCNPYISATQCRRPLIFQTVNSVKSNSFSIIY